MANWKVVVDADTCIGCQTCTEVAPNSYKMNDSDIAEFVGFNDDDDTVMNGAKSCPVDAIIVTDLATGKKFWPE